LLEAKASLVREENVRWTPATAAAGAAWTAVAASNNTVMRLSLLADMTVSILRFDR
jgi:hypothetical protein